MRSCLVALHSVLLRDDKADNDNDNDNDDDDDMDNGSPITLIMVLSSRCNMFRCLTSSGVTVIR